MWLTILWPKETNRCSYIHQEINNCAYNRVLKLNTPVFLIPISWDQSVTSYSFYWFGIWLLDIVRTSSISSPNHRILEGRVVSPKEADGLGSGWITQLRVFAVFILSLMGPSSVLNSTLWWYFDRTLQYSHKNSQSPTCHFERTQIPIALKEYF